MTHPHSSLAAVVYDKGAFIDNFMRTVADRLRAAGLRVGGVFQENQESDAACATMRLVDLTSGERFVISQNLGTDSRGCRLDPRGVVDAGAQLNATLADDVDILVINKFGRGDAEGGGLRVTFAAAIDAGIPVLTAVRPPYVEAWTAFHGGLADNLPLDLDAVLAWLPGGDPPARRRSHGIPMTTQACEASRAAVIGVAAYCFRAGATQSRSMPST
jgi:nucleoside-triphosphatase THEP1